MVYLVPPSLFRAAFLLPGRHRAAEAPLKLAAPADGLAKSNLAEPHNTRRVDEFKLKAPLLPEHPMDYLQRILIALIDALVEAGRTRESIDVGILDGQVRPWNFHEMKELAAERYPHLPPLYTDYPLQPGK